MTRNVNPFSNAENFPEILENCNTLTGKKWAVFYLSPVCLSAGDTHAIFVLSLSGRIPPQITSYCFFDTINFHLRYGLLS